MEFMNYIDNEVIKEYINNLSNDIKKEYNIRWNIQYNKNIFDLFKSIVMEQQSISDLIGINIKDRITALYIKHKYTIYNLDHMQDLINFLIESERFFNCSKVGKKWEEVSTAKSYIQQIINQEEFKKQEFIEE